MKKFFKYLNLKNFNKHLIFILLNFIKIITKFKFSYSKTKVKNKDIKILNNFCNFVQKKLNTKVFDSKKMILMDCCNIPSYIITNLILSSELKNLMKAKMFSLLQRGGWSKKHL